MENGKMEKMEKIPILDICSCYTLILKLLIIHFWIHLFLKSFMDSFIFEIIFGKLLN